MQVPKRRKLTSYYYRVDPEKKINIIKDGFLRARLWRPGGFPHKNLNKIYTQKIPGQDVYRVCFYDKEIFARARLDEFSSNTHIQDGGVRILTRWPRSAPGSAGFTWSHDSGFVLGDASLYWIVEQSNGDLSSAKIDLGLAEVWDVEQNIWVPLIANYPSLNPNHAPASQTPSTGPIVNPVGGIGVSQSGKKSGA
ncbi:MAG: hypothetical protein RSF42_19050 [Comamonas sp.]